MELLALVGREAAVRVVVPSQAVLLAGRHLAEALVAVLEVPPPVGRERLEALVVAPRALALGGRQVAPGALGGRLARDEQRQRRQHCTARAHHITRSTACLPRPRAPRRDRKSTRLNSSHSQISY